MEYNGQTLRIISQSNILQSEDMQSIQDLVFELSDTFMTAQVFRTRTEMDVSILNDLKFPTPDSKYWQAKREQNVMFNELVMLSFEYRKNNVEIRQLEIKLKNENDDLERELLQIEIEKKQFISLNQEHTAKDRIREIKEWHEIKEKLLPDLVNSTVDVNEHQLVSYTQRWINQLAAMGDGGSPSERHNLLGQLEKSLKVCKEKNCLEAVLSVYDPSVRLSLIAGGMIDKTYLDSAKT